MIGLAIVIYIVLLVGFLTTGIELSKINERDSNNDMESSNSNSNMGSVCSDMSNIQLCVPPKEQVNHPNHYNQGQYECINGKHLWNRSHNEFLFAMCIQIHLENK